MTRFEIEQVVLELIEEDYYGVWEIGWRLASALGINPGVDARLPAAAIASLRDRGLVDLYVREWIDDTPRPIERSGRTLDLTRPSSWREPSMGDPQFLIGAPGDAVANDA